MGRLAYYTALFGTACCLSKFLGWVACGFFMYTQYTPARCSIFLVCTSPLIGTFLMIQQLLLPWFSLFFGPFVVLSLWPSQLDVYSNG